MIDTRFERTGRFDLADDEEYDDESVEHPYAKEWVSSHYLTTPSGDTVHVSCSADFIQQHGAMEWLRALIEAAKKTPVNELKRLTDNYEHPNTRTEI